MASLLFKSKAQTQLEEEIRLEQETLVKRNTSYFILVSLFIFFRKGNLIGCWIVSFLISCPPLRNASKLALHGVEFHLNEIILFSHAGM